MRRGVVRTASIVIGLLLSGRRAVKAVTGNTDARHAAPAAPQPEPREQRQERERPSGLTGYIKTAVKRFSDDDCMTEGAAIAYYTLFSLPSLLLIIVGVVGLVLGRAAVQGQIQQQIQGLVGQGSGAQVQTMVQHASQNHTGGIVGTIIGILALLFGATGTFAALQQALNRTWEVKPDPNAGGVKYFLGKRLLSVGMILGIGFLLLVSLALSAAIAAFGGWAATFLPSFLSGPLLRILGIIASFVVITLLFAAIFKLLPDASIEWRQVWIGAAITSVLFTIGKTAIGYYLGKSGAASAYGAAGSLVVIVLWTYYASLILLFGAEFTQVWAAAHGHAIKPQKGAVRVVREERQVDTPKRAA